MSEIFDRLQNIVSLHLGVPKEEINSSSEFSGDLNADPVSLADLYTVIEDQFQISLPAEDLVNIATVSDLAEAVNERVSEVGFGQ